MSLAKTFGGAGEEWLGPFFSRTGGSAAKHFPQTYVLVIFFTLPLAAGLLLARRLCKSGALKFLSARSF